MTQPTDIDRLTLRSPDALLAAIPYLLGFHPRESAVIVWLSDRRILLTQRIDLPADSTPLASWSRAVWAHRAAAVAQEIVLVVVSVTAPDPAVIDAVVGPAETSQVQVRDVLRLDGDRWWSLLCDSSDCCPPEGRLVDRGVSDAVGAEFALMGRAPLGKRSDLEEQVRPDPVRAAAVAAMLERGSPRDESREAWRDRMVERVERLLLSERPLAAGDVADVACGLRDVRVRDTVLWCATEWDPTTLLLALHRLLEAVRAVPAGLAAPVATCAGILAWLSGDGARAWVAADRALAADRDYSLAQLLAASLEAGLPPATWREAMAAVGRDQCRHGARVPPRSG